MNQPANPYLIVIAAALAIALILLQFNTNKAEEKWGPLIPATQGRE